MAVALLLAPRLLVVDRVGHRQGRAAGAVRERGREEAFEHVLLRRRVRHEVARQRRTPEQLEEARVGLQVGEPRVEATVGARGALGHADEHLVPMRLHPRQRVVAQEQVGVGEQHVRVRGQVPRKELDRRADIVAPRLHLLVAGAPRLGHLAKLRPCARSDRQAAAGIPRDPIAQRLHLRPLGARQRRQCKLRRPQVREVGNLVAGGSQPGVRGAIEAVRDRPEWRTAARRLVRAGLQQRAVDLMLGGHGSVVSPLVAQRHDDHRARVGARRIVAVEGAEASVPAGVALAPRESLVNRAVRQAAIGVARAVEDPEPQLVEDVRPDPTSVRGSLGQSLIGQVRGGGSEGEGE
mmetsp:Transcript_6800/g.17849  ORF Transcript_6800/g.17849 Transcript_6800/m.17849 type:complete len:351 (+) Transcript_6800:586-1638(+)